MSKKTPHANRGKSFEKLIDETNKAYEFQELALVQKIPNEWTIVRRGPQIVSAFSRAKSTVDFIGILSGGQGCCLEAKQTANKTSFPLSNIKPHQIEYLSKFAKLGGIAFFLINFSSLGRTFLLPISVFEDFIQKNSSKSIPLKFFVEYTYEVYSVATMPVDYLRIIMRGEY
jgi:recombination protein U